MYDSGWMDHNVKSETTIPIAKSKVICKNGPYAKGFRTSGLEGALFPKESKHLLEAAPVAGLFGVEQGFLGFPQVQLEQYPDALRTAPM